MNDVLRLFGLFIFLGGCGGPSCSHIQKFHGAYAWSPGTTPLPNESGDDKPVYLIADEDGRVRRVDFSDGGEPDVTVLLPRNVCGGEDVATSCRLASRPGGMTYALEQRALRSFDDDGQRAWTTEGSDLSDAVMTIDRTDGVAIAEASEEGLLQLRSISADGQGSAHTFAIFDSAGDAAHSVELASIQLLRPLADGDLLLAATVRGANPQALAEEHSFVTRLSTDAEVRWAKRFTNDVLFAGTAPRVLGAREFASGEIALAVGHPRVSALIVSANGEVLRHARSPITFEMGSVEPNLGFPMAASGDHVLFPATYRGALQVDSELSSSLEFTTAGALQPTDGRGTALGERPDLTAIQSDGDRIFFQVTGANAAQGIVSLTQVEASAASASLDSSAASDAQATTDLALRVTRSVGVEVESWTVPALQVDDPPLSPLTADCSGDNNPC